MKTMTTHPRATEFSDFIKILVDLMLPNLQKKELNNLGKTIT